MPFLPIVSLLHHDGYACIGDRPEIRHNLPFTVWSFCHSISGAIVEIAELDTKKLKAMLRD
jgi:hypothetical protein